MIPTSNLYRDEQNSTSQVFTTRSRTPDVVAWARCPRPSVGYVWHVSVPPDVFESSWKAVRNRLSIQNLCAHHWNDGANCNHEIHEYLNSSYYRFVMFSRVTKPMTCSLKVLMTQHPTNVTRTSTNFKILSKPERGVFMLPADRISSL